MATIGSLERIANGHLFHCPQASLKTKFHSNVRIQTWLAGYVFTVASACPTLSYLACKTSPRGRIFVDKGELGHMTSEILENFNSPAIAVMTAVAMHPRPDDFCREIALRSLNETDVQAVAIVNLGNHAELQIVGSYGPKLILDQINGYSDRIQTAIREKNRVSVHVFELDDEKVDAQSLVLVPSTPMTMSTGVLAVFFSNKKPVEVFDANTRISLAFASEMYCSPNWGLQNNASIRSKRAVSNSTAEDKLTARQKAVLEYIAAGKTNDRIARLLNYSVATVKNDISALFQFLGVSNRQDAVDEAKNRLLLPPPPPPRVLDKIT